MSITISANSNMVGGLFNSMNKNLFNSSSGNMFSGMGMMGGINFSDYASIRNGSYHKLLSSYYSLGDMDSDFKVDSGCGRFLVENIPLLDERRYCGKDV